MKVEKKESEGSTYKITPYTKHQASVLGVKIKPSEKKNKKIDVYKDGKKIASVGAAGYGDYPTFIKSHGKKFADEKRKQYKKRHNKDRSVKNSNGYYAVKLLW